MHWQTKARIQNAVARLPSSVSYAVYYWLQRRLGALRRVNPVSRLAAGVEVCRQIERAGRRPGGGTFLEVGTGWRLNSPLAFWLAGAEKVITVDLNPYLREELVRADLGYILENRAQIERLFAGRLDESRFARLLEFARTRRPLADLLGMANIEYLAPADAARLPLAEGSVDFHVSYVVFEHIPPVVLKNILREGSRVVRSRGLFVHHVDFSDHFSHTDRGISTINFLQFSDDRWQRLAGNRYMYMNRLRVDDFLELFEASGHRVLLNEPQMDAAVHAMLERGGLTLDARFAQKSRDVLATTAAWIVSETADSGVPQSAAWALAPVSEQHGTVASAKTADITTEPWLAPKRLILRRNRG